MRHRSIAIPAGAVTASLAMLLAATAALAGGWAQVTATNVPVDPPAGEETTISLTMLQHGQTPVSWPRLTVIAVEKTSGAVVTAEATPSGTTGSYVAKLTFPKEGQWTLSYLSQDLIMEGSATVRVTPLVAAPPAATPATDTAAVLLPLAAVIGIFVVLIAGVVILSRRGAAPLPAGAQASATTGTQVSAGS